MTTRAYVRISTQEKGKESISLSLQEERIKEFCQEPVTIYRDVASAGSVNRPGYLSLLKDLKRGDRLVIYRLDRLTRSSFDFADFWRGYILKKKIDFVSVTQNYDTLTPSGRFQLKIMVDVADLEREMIKLRTREALAEKRKQNLVISHYLPYGYQRDGKHLIPDPREQRVLRRMKKWREEKMSFEAIARRLEKTKVKSKRNLGWKGYTVIDIFKREALVEADL